MLGRKLAFGTLVAACMLVVGQGAASANVMWCLSDPPIQVVTPDGRYVMVNNQVYVPPAAVHLKGAITDSAVATPDGSGGTLITVRTFIPAGMTAAQVVSSENRYGISDLKYGAGGTTVTTYLDIPAS